MNILSILFAIFIIYCLWANFKKTFVFIIVCSIWLMHIQSGLSGGLTFYTLISIAAFIIFILKDHNQFSEVSKFPLWLPFLVTATSFLLTNFIIGPLHTPRTILLFVPHMLNVYMFWNLLCRYPKVICKLFAEISFFYGFFIAVYNFVELIFQFNPIVETFLKLGVYKEEGQVLDVFRFGFKRIQSIFLMHTTNGCACTLLFITLCYFYLNTEYLQKYKLQLLLLLPMLFFSVFFTGARSCMVGIIICSLCLINRRFMTTKNIFVLLSLCILLIPLVGDYANEIISSIVNSDKAHFGSSENMRQGQFEISLYFMKMSLWLGNGIGYTWSYVQENYRSEIFGAESLWFPIMIDRGILGLSAMFSYWVFLIIIALKKQKQIVFFILGILTMNSMSSLPSFEPMYTTAYLLIFLTMLGNRRGSYSMTKIGIKNETKNTISNRLLTL